MDAPLATASRAPLRAPLGTVRLACGPAGRSEPRSVRRIGPFWRTPRAGERRPLCERRLTPPLACGTGERDLVSIAARSSHEWLAVLLAGAPCSRSDRIQSQVR